MTSAATVSKRDRLLDYFQNRADLPASTRREIKAKIRAASNGTILADQPCVGKHWFVMDFDERNVCPYCDWKLVKP